MKRQKPPKKEQKRQNKQNCNEKTLKDYFFSKIPKKSKSKSKQLITSSSFSDDNNNRDNSAGSLNKSTPRSEAGKRSPNINVFFNNFSHIFKFNDFDLTQRNFSKIVLFNEDLIENFKKCLHPLFDKIFKEFSKQTINGFEFFEVINYNSFIVENFDNLLIKFFLQSANFNEDKLLFISKSFLDFTEFDTTKLKLFEGFDRSKETQFLYYPNCAKEEANEEISKKISSYLIDFQKRKRKQALVLFDPVDPNLLKYTIEGICSENSFKLLHLDSLEKDKTNKLKQISEATQSKRISTIDDSLNEKIHTIEKIINQNKQKFRDILTLEDTDIEKMVTNSMKSSNIETNENITKYFDENTKEKNSFRVIQNNIYKISSSKRTVILVMDTSETNCNNDDKNFISALINKVSNAKCPIIIVTDNINLITPDSNIFNGKGCNEYFDVFVNVEKNQKFKQKIVFLTSFIIFMHFLVEPLMKYEKDFQNLGEFNQILEKIVKRLTFSLNENEHLFEKIAELSLKTAINNQYNLGNICYYLKKIIRSNNDFDLMQFDFYLKCLDFDLNNSKNEQNFQIFENFERKSFNDFLFNQHKKIIDNKFSNILFQNIFENRKSQNKHKNSENYINSELVQTTFNHQEDIFITNVSKIQ